MAKCKGTRFCGTIALLIALGAWLLGQQARHDSGPSLASSVAPSYPFDMLSIAKTPTCINYMNLMSAVKYLKPQGLRKVWFAVPPEWVDAVSRWHPDITAIADSEAVPGVSKQRIKQLLRKYGWLDDFSAGRDSSGWYLHQFLNLAFVLRSDVLDMLLLQDADMMVLPSFRMFGEGHFVAPDGTEKPKIRLKIGGVNVTTYDFAYECLTGNQLVLPEVDLGFPHNYVAHSWVAFKPYAKEVLEAFLSARPFPNDTREVDTSGTAEWAEKIVQCLNPEHPTLGFAESFSYISYMLKHHKYSYEIESEQSWIRNMDGLGPGRDGFCCPTREMYNKHAAMGYQYAGFELGHDINVACKYNSGEFGKNPYPPNNASFWSQRGVDLSKSAALRPVSFSPSELPLVHHMRRINEWSFDPWTFRIQHSPQIRLTDWDVVTGGFPLWSLRAPYDLSLEDSSKVLQEISESSPRDASSEVVFHTEFNPDIKVDSCIKNLLPVLSALATEQNAQIYVWFYGEGWTPESLACFDPIKQHPRHSSRLHLEFLDIDKELAKIDENSGFDDANERALYKATALGKGVKGKKANFSNLRRYLMLFNYGGVWLDTDVVLLNPFSKLSGSWIYGCPETFKFHENFDAPKYWSVHLNGALMAAHAPRADWILACMQRVLKLLVEQNTSETAGHRHFYKWGGGVFWHLQQVALSEGLHAPFMVLPCDWFDFGWRHSGILPGTKINWEYIFSEKASRSDVEATMASGAFAFHFHGGASGSIPVSRESIASHFARHFQDVLKLSIPSME